jgi:hypothetical protein
MLADVAGFIACDVAGFIACDYAADRVVDSARLAHVQTKA